MVHHHRENQQLPRGRGSQIPIRATALRRPGLRSGGPPPEPITETRTPRITIRIPPRPGNGETGPATPHNTRGDVPETAPPQYTERVGPESVNIPKIEDEPPTTERGEQSGDTIQASRTEPTTGGEQNEGSSGLDAVRGSAVVASSISQQAAGEQNEGSDGSSDTIQGSVVAPNVRQQVTSEQNKGSSRLDTSQENTTMAPSTSQQADGGKARGSSREEPRRTEIKLDLEIAELIRRIAQEQVLLRSEVVKARDETFEVRVMVKAHETRLKQVFKRMGDIIHDQSALHAGVDDLQTAVKDIQKAAEIRGQARTPTRSSHKSGPVSPNVSREHNDPQRSVMGPRSDIESLYASEGGNHTGQNQGQEDPGNQPNVNLDRRQEVADTPGEAWIRRRETHRFGLGTDEAVERWRAASEASRQRREQGRRGTQEPQQQGEEHEQRRSVTQLHEVGFGRYPNPPTPSGDGSGSSDGSGQRDGYPIRRSRHGSDHSGRRSRSRTHASGRHSNGGRRTPRQRGRRSPSHSSSSGSSDDWDSKFTVLDDDGRRQRERRERRRNPKAEYEQEQLRKIRERIQKMVGQDIQYAATYKGVKDVTIVKYAGQNDNGIFTRWLDHLLLYFQLSRMCGPDNELVRLSAMYNSLEGVAEEWYRDLILHTPKQSWTFEKAVCSLFLTYVFGAAASQAAQDFSEVKYSRTEGAREYAQRLKTKARRLARKPDESTMIIRFLAGLPMDLSRRLTLRERLDPARHRFKDFVAKLHELEEAENVTKTVNTAVMDIRKNLAGYATLCGTSRVLTGTIRIDWNSSPTMQ